MGLLIQRFRLQPFIVTLAGMFLARGLCYVISIDSISITVSPARCAGTTLYHAFRFDDALSTPAGKAVTTDLFNGLVARKASTSDELYDSNVDPGMRHNLIADARAGLMRGELADLHKQVASGRPVRYNIPAEEQRRLRSLGYLH